MSTGLEQEVGTGAARQAKRRRLPGTGLLKGLTVTLKHMLQRSITQEYPDEKPNLPPRTPAPPRGPPAETAPARPAATEQHEVEPDQETLDRVLAEELAKGTDRR